MQEPPSASTKSHVDRDIRSSFGSFFGILNCAELKGASVEDVARNALLKEVRIQSNIVFTNNGFHSRFDGGYN
jgi:hypothetical protein